MNIRYLNDKFQKDLDSFIQQLNETISELLCGNYKLTVCVDSKLYSIKCENEAIEIREFNSPDCAYKSISDIPIDLLLQISKSIENICYVDVKYVTELQHEIITYIYDRSNERLGPYETGDIKTVGDNEIRLLFLNRDELNSFIEGMKEIFSYDDESLRISYKEVTI